ncbi:hypothetical protein BH10ACI1_BH10ACI1_33790 [soil metagenome]
MKRINFVKFTSLFFIGTNAILAQMPKVTVPPAQTPMQSQVPLPVTAPEDHTWWIITLIALFIGLASAIAWLIKSKKQTSEKVISKNEIPKNAWDAHAVDADLELEWYRKHRKAVKPNQQNNRKMRVSETLPQGGKVLKRQNSEISSVPAELVTQKDLQEKLEQLQFSQLPIARIDKIKIAKPFTPLPISNDEALLCAIEQVKDEYEEDEQVRDLALRILAAFKTRNAVESLSEIALYDLSSNLRSKAVTTLTELDHESVFEPILLACADPTREVRAAAARGLFRLSFDRADAWSRIAQTADEFKMRQSSRAAIEADLVKRSFARLAHTDEKSAYEAVTLITLLLKAGETKEIFEALLTHPVMNVRKAILKIIKFTKEPNALEGLYSLLEQNTLPPDLQIEVDETIKEIGLVMA